MEKQRLKPALENGWLQNFGAYLLKKMKIHQLAALEAAATQIRVILKASLKKVLGKELPARVTMIIRRVLTRMAMKIIPRHLSRKSQLNRTMKAKKTLMMKIREARLITQGTM
jgi:hypothetical protein